MCYTNDAMTLRWVDGKQRLISKVYAEPRYGGKQVIIIHGQIFPTAGGTASFRKLKSLLKRYPRETPTIVYVPKADTLILLL